MKKTNAAFTVVELIVCIGIISLLSALIFWNGRGFSDKITVTSVAQEVSLAVREGQVYGIAVREGTTGTNIFTYGYGIIFNKSNPTFVIVFVDKNNNKMYDGGTACDGTDECVDKVPLRNGVVIASVCATNSAGSTTCPANWRSVQAVFIRPSLDATVTVIDNTNSVVSGPWTSGAVILRSLLGATKTVSVSSTGQVSVQ